MRLSRQYSCEFSSILRVLNNFTCLFRLTFGLIAIAPYEIFLSWSLIHVSYKMRKFLIYTSFAVATVILAAIESGQHMGISGFIAIFLCQPWLAIIWLLVVFGVPIPEFGLNAISVGAMVGLNIFIWGIFLFLKRK